MNIHLPPSFAEVVRRPIRLQRHFYVGENLVYLSRGLSSLRTPADLVRTL